MPTETKATSAKGRQAGDYEPPVLAEPKGGPVPTYRPPAKPPSLRRSLRHLPGKHNQLSHAHGGSGKKKDDPDEESGDGMPATIVSQSVRLAAGGRAIIDRPGTRSRLTAGNRSVSFDTERRRTPDGELIPTDTERLRRLITRAQYSEPGSVHRLDGDDGPTISIRPVPGRWVTDTGRVVDSPDDAPRRETYPAEYDLTLGDGEPVRVSLSELDDDIADGLEAVASARRVETGFGPVDVFVPSRGRIGIRVPTDDGPVELEFDKKDWRRLWAGIDKSLDGRTSVTVDTAHGPIRIQTDNTADAFIDKDTLFFMSPAGDDESWSIAAQGDGIKALLSAMTANGRAIGVGF